jgi:LPS-assembly protein
MPARWLEISVYQSRSAKNLATDEFNSAITLRDGNRWTLRFANNFFHGWRTYDPRVVGGFTRQGAIQDYAVDGRFRLHERFDALARLHYDARKRRFTEQSYGLVQNLDNTWRVSYVMSLYEGRARESRFGLNFQIEAVGF